MMFFFRPNPNNDLLAIAAEMIANPDIPMTIEKRVVRNMASFHYRVKCESFEILARQTWLHDTAPRADINGLAIPLSMRWNRIMFNTIGTRLQIISARKLTKQIDDLAEDLLAKARGDVERLEAAGVTTKRVDKNDMLTSFIKMLPKTHSLIHDIKQHTKSL